MRRLSGHLGGNDHAVRMRALFYNDDNVSGLRAAARLDAAQAKLGKAWAAVNKRAKNARALLNAVPRSLHADPAYHFIEIQWHRRAGKELAAAQRMAKAPRDVNALIDPDEWWIERRLNARNALEAGKPRLAYQIAAGHAAQTNWLQVEAEFHAGWIALRFLNDPNTAIRHFQHTVDIARTPISRGRAHYWMGRALQAAGQPPPPPTTGRPPHSPRPTTGNWRSMPWADTAYRSPSARPPARTLPPPARCRPSNCSTRSARRPIWARSSTTCANA